MKIYLYLYIKNIYLHIYIDENKKQRITRTKQKSSG